MALKASTVQRVILVVGVLCCILSLVLFVFLDYDYHRDVRQHYQDALIQGQKQAADAAIKIDSDLQRFVGIADTIAEELNTGALPYANVADRLAREIQTNSYLLGITVAFEPYVYNDETRLYAPYFKKNNRGAVESMLVGYDYTALPSDEPGAADTSWYYEPLNQGPTWVEPYFGQAANELLSGYAIPFYRLDAASQQQVPAGVVIVDLPLRNADHLMDSLNLGSTGYGYILSREGLFIAHPVKEYIGTRTIFEIARELQDDNMREIGRQALEEQQFVVHTVDKVTGLSSWVIHEPIPSMGWSIGVVLQTEELAPDPRITMEQKVTMGLVLAVFVFFLAVVLFRAHHGNPRSLWFVSVTWSLLCVLTIGLIWHFASGIREEGGVMIVNRSGMDRFLNSFTQDVKDHTGSPPTYIPTGIMLQTIQFNGPNDVTLGGHIWQKYSDDLDDNIARGFIFPQQGGFEVTREIYRRHQDGMEIIGWQFLIPLRQPFNPYKYPFDNEDVTLRIRHRDFDKNVVLVPDFESYELIKPSLKPALDEEIVVEGRLIDQTFFSYFTHDYGTGFGSHHMINQQVPELYFNISVHRDFVDSMVEHIIPISIICLMMFIVMLITREPDHKEIFSVLSYAAALFFVAAISHTNLRQEIAATGLTYFEYFYIMIYVIILAVSVDTILYHSKVPVWIIQYKNNLIPKLLYGPLLLSILALVTWKAFVLGEAPTHREEEETLKSVSIALVTDVRGAEDGGINQAIWQGLQQVATTTNVSVSLIESDDTTAYANNLNKAAEQEYDLIVSAGEAIADAVYEATERYPQVLFALFDQPADPKATNMIGITFTSDETGLLSGYLAAAIADLNDPAHPQVGYIAGEQNPQTERLIAGYCQGILHYNRMHQKAVACDGHYVGSSDVREQGKAQTFDLIDAGSDVVLSTGGETGNGVLLAASERGIPAIGADVDQYETLPEAQDVLLTSNVKNLYQVTADIVYNLQKGIFNGGTNYQATLATNGVGLAPFHTFEDRIPAPIIEDMTTLVQEVKVGDVWTGWDSIGGSRASSTVQATISSDSASVRLNQRATRGSGLLLATIELSTTSSLRDTEFALPIQPATTVDIARLDQTFTPLIQNGHMVTDTTAISNLAYYSGTLSLDPSNSDAIVVSGLDRLSGHMVTLRSYYLENGSTPDIQNMRLIQQIRLYPSAAERLQLADVLTHTDTLTIGVLLSANYPILNADYRGFRDALRDNGYIGENVVLHEQNAQNNPVYARQIADAFASGQYTLLYTLGTLASQTVTQVYNETETPIVFSSVYDPQGAGMVPNLAQPGGNVTGTSDRVPIANQLDMIQQVMPNMKQLGVVYNEAEQNARIFIERLNDEAARRDITIVTVPVRRATPTEIGEAAEQLVTENAVDAMLLPSDNAILAATDQIVAVCDTYQIPLFSPFIVSVSQGAVAALGIDYYDLGYQSGEVAVRVLDGEDPGEIAVESATTLQLWVNLSAAEQQGITIPDGVIKQADRVLD